MFFNTCENLLIKPVTLSYKRDKKIISFLENNRSSIFQSLLFTQFLNVLKKLPTSQSVKINEYVFYFLCSYSSIQKNRDHHSCKRKQLLCGCTIMRLLRSVFNDSFTIFYTYKCFHKKKRKMFLIVSNSTTIKIRKAMIFYNYSSLLRPNSLIYVI